MKIEGLYVITDETIRPGRKHEDIARAAIEGGASVVQIRDKVSTDRRFFEDALKIRQIAREAGVTFIVNDRVDIALAVDADGVNIGEHDLPVSAARRILGAGKLIGASASTIEEARQKAADGADYLGFGPIFPTATKPDAGPPTGLETLRALCSEGILPVVAIGGIDLNNISYVAAAGACAAAVVSAVVGADDMVRTVGELVREFEKGKAQQAVKR